MPLALDVRYKSVCRVLDGSGKRAGCGFITCDRTVVTAAHVVNRALGRAMRTPDLDPGALVLVEVLSDDDRWLLRRCVVTGWGPVSSERAFKWLPQHDVALLTPEEALPSACQGAAICVPDEGPALVASPDASTFVRVEVVGKVLGGLVQVDHLYPDGERIEPGWSGAAVWQGDSVTGIVLLQRRATPPPRGALTLPSERMAELLTLRLAEPGQSCTQPVLPIASEGPAPLGTPAQGLKIDIWIVAEHRTDLLALLNAFGIPRATPPREAAGADIWGTSIGQTQIGIFAVGADGGRATQPFLVQFLQLRERYGGKLVLLPRLVAGVSGEVNIGDVILSDRIVDLRRVPLGAALSTGDQALAPQPRVVRAISQLGTTQRTDSEWSAGARQLVRALPTTRDEAALAHWNPTIRVGAIGSSDLISQTAGGPDTSLPQLDAVALGIWEVVRGIDPSVDWLVVGGVSDLVEPLRAKTSKEGPARKRESDSWSFAATQAMAHAVVRFVAEWD